MPSNLVRKLAGSFIEHKLPVNPTLLWATYQCRHGALAASVKKFCAEQSEPLRPALAIVESMTPNEIICCVPCRCTDHESPNMFDAEVRFALNPVSGETRRYLP